MNSINQIMSTEENSIKPTPSFPDLKLATTRVSFGRRLPRWEANGAVYHIAIHLADSVPAEQLRAWREGRQRLLSLLQTENRPMTIEEELELYQLYDERIEKYLTSGYGECLLRDEVAAQALEETVEHSNGTLYALHEWTIMPNHFHVIVGGFDEGRPMRDLLAVWKRVSAHRINRALGRSGAVWSEDAYTRIIRDEQEYLRQIDYVWNNPESAGLAEGFKRRRYYG